MSLKDVMATDAAAFTNSSEFGEAVTVVLSNGTTRAISAVIDRQPPQRVMPGGELYAPAMQITVANSATTGIASTEDLSGAIRIRIPRRIGMTAEEFGVYEPAGLDRWCDEGMLILDVK